MAKITKALIPAAGYGTRFLPQTKAMPKEMLPLVDKPIIQRVVEELVEAGIETIVIVTGWNKRSIEDHFDNHSELEEMLYNSGKMEAFNTVRQIANLAEFIYLRQKGPMGNATPILNAKSIMGNDPFLVCWGDDFVDASPTRAQQLIAAFEKYNSPIVGGLNLESDDAHKKYGYVGGDQVEDGVIRLTKIVEKPGQNREGLSNLAILSGFIATPDIYAHLEEAKKNLTEGELVYTYGLQGMIDKGQPVHAIELKNAIYRDTGNKLEYLKTVVDYAINHPEVGKDFREYLKKITSS
jgi:UTP--glucose-1-phosphate uridylyltransferase